MTKHEKLTPEQLLEKHPGIAFNRDRSGVVEIASGPGSLFTSGIEVILLPFVQDEEPGISIFARKGKSIAGRVDVLSSAGVDTAEPANERTVTAAEMLGIAAAGMELFADYEALTAEEREAFDDLPGAADKINDALAGIEPSPLYLPGHQTVDLARPLLPPPTS